MTIEELQEELLKERERAEQLKAEYDALKTKNTELVEANSKLTEYNNKLFMRVTEQQEEQQEEQRELTPEELESQTIEEIRKIMAERRN